MEKEDRDIFRHISVTLDEILVVLSKPTNKINRIFDIVGFGIALLGILTAIDIIMNWIGG